MPLIRLFSCTDNHRTEDALLQFKSQGQANGEGQVLWLQQAGSHPALP